MKEGGEETLKFNCDRSHDYVMYVTCNGEKNLRILPDPEELYSEDNSSTTNPQQLLLGYVAIIFLSMGSTNVICLYVFIIYY